jgi:hypothetical protein
MARNSEPREDLLRDARALSPRVMLQVEFAGGEVELFAGFRGDSLSLYFGDDPVYHFNADGELRRAFVNGQVIKAEKRRVVFLRRRLSDAATTLERQSPDIEVEQAFQAEMQRRLDELRSALAREQVEVIGEAPASGEALPRLVAWLELHRSIEIAASPRVT